MGTKPLIALLGKSTVMLLMGLTLCAYPGRPFWSARRLARHGGPADNPLKGEIASFAVLQGSWTCEGVFPSSGKRINSTISFASDLDGVWLSIHHNDLPPNKFYDVEYWGFDSAEKQLVAFVFDNFGGARKFTSSGWAGDRFIWLGETSKTSPPTTQRFVYERDGANELTVNWEVSKGTAVDWTVGDTLTCRK